ADDAAAPQRHSLSLAIRNGFLRRRLRQPARLGLALSRALRLGPDGCDLRQARRRRSAARPVLSRRPRCVSHRLQRRLQPAVSAAEASFPLRDRRPAAWGGRVARRQSVLRQVGLHVQGTRQHSKQTSAIAIDNWPGGRMNNRILKSAMYIAMGMSLAAALPVTVAHAASDGSLVGKLVDASN